MMRPYARTSFTVSYETLFRRNRDIDEVFEALRLQSSISLGDLDPSMFERRSTTEAKAIICTLILQRELLSRFPNLAAVDETRVRRYNTQRNNAG